MYTGGEPKIYLPTFVSYFQNHFFKSEVDQGHFLSSNIYVSYLRKKNSSINNGIVLNKQEKLYTLIYSQSKSVLKVRKKVDANPFLFSPLCTAFFHKS